MVYAFDMPAPIHADRELVKSLFIQGFNPCQIAQKTGLNPNTIATWSKRGGWTEIRAKTCEALNQPTEQVAAVSLAKRSANVREALGQELEAQTALLLEHPPQSLNCLANTPKGQGRSSLVKTLAEAADRTFDWGTDQGMSLINIEVLDRVLDLDEERTATDPMVERVNRLAMSVVECEGPPTGES